MKELFRDIRDAIELHYEKKLKHSDYYGDQKIWDMVENCVSDLQDMALNYESTIDEYIQEKEDAWQETLEKLKEKGIHYE